MDEEDNRLLDNHHHPSHNQNQPKVMMEPNNADTTAEDEEEQDQMKMMVRYWRSKSLPYAYFPEMMGNGVGVDKGKGIVGANHPNNTSMDTGSQISSSVFCSEMCSNGSGHHKECRKPSSHSHCNHNDPGCKPGTCSSGNVNVANKNRDQKNGHAKNIGAGGGGASSGASGEQESGEGKRRMDWRTLQQHYYPEGGFGYIITFCALFSHALAFGIQVYLSNIVFHRFNKGWLGSLSMAVSLFISPVAVSICRRKSTRLSAVFGGLVASLGCLFTSFATQFHQICISYGGFIGVGVGFTRDASTLMVGQYFKRKRDLVEMFVVSGSGVGLIIMSVCTHLTVGSLGWRLGLQAVTGTVFLTFFLGTCYRSASLYHPQRRAILHLKNQKRKIKEKEKREEKQPFIDFKCLKSKTLQILLVSSAFTAFGVYTPLFHMALECKAEGEDHTSLLLLHVYIGISWILGCLLFGIMVIQKNQECRVSKQYLCQMASVISAISILTLTTVEGLGGLVVFSWVYGFTLGAYNYSLKVYTYERVRARHFPRAWSFVQWSQSIPLVIGVPLTGHMNAVIGWKSGYYLSALAVFVGTAFLFLTDVRRRRLSRRKTPNSSMKTNETTDSIQSPKMRRLSFSYPLDQFPAQSKNESDHGAVNDPDLGNELTCISEEGLEGIDFQDIYFDEWAEYLGECITSCNKVENCLASEYDPELAVMVERRARRWSAARPSFAQAAHAGIGQTAAALAGGVVGVHNSNLLIPPLQHHLTYPNLGGSSSPGSVQGAGNEFDGNEGEQGAAIELPVYRSTRHAQATRTISVIDEAEASTSSTGNTE